MVIDALIYILGGISLSPAFVVMFAMQHFNLSWEDALHMVQNRRYCISPNGGFLTQIKVRNFVYILADSLSLNAIALPPGIRVDLQSKERRCLLPYNAAAGFQTEKRR